VEVLNYEGRPSYFKKFIRRSFKHAAESVSVSRYLAEGVNRLAGPAKFSIIPNATDTGLFYYKEREQGIFRFIHVSNMVPLKNAEGILRAFKLLLDEGIKAELLMVGNPDDSMPNYAITTGLTNEQVRFTGEIPYTAVAEKMQESDCLLLYSNIENSPCVIGEALCCGLPVIATNVGGIPEITDSSNSLLTEPGNDSAFAGRMKEMIENYTVYDRKKIAEAAKDRFSYDVIGKQFDDLYERQL
jgi:glycosyltransferase involved in cell wall biosynthesis